MKEKRALLGILIAGGIVNLLLASAAASFYIFLVQPLSTAFANATRELALLEEEKASLLTSAREIEQRSKDLNKLEAAFLNLDDMITFITFLETLAAQSSVTISINAPATGNPVVTKQAEFSVSVTGTLANTMRFIKQVELMPYFIQIPSVNLTSKGTQLQAILYLAVLVL